MLLCYSAIPSRSLRSAYQLMISGGDVKAVQGTTPVQAAPVEAEPTISVPRAHQNPTKNRKIPRGIFLLYAICTVSARFLHGPHFSCQME